MGRTVSAEATTTVAADWVWWSKEPGAPGDYGILATSASERAAVFARRIRRRQPGNPGGELAGRPAALPWVSFSPARSPDAPVVGLRILTWSEAGDVAGRPITPTFYVEVPFAQLAAAGATYGRLYQAGEQGRVDVASRLAASRAADRVPPVDLVLTPGGPEVGFDGLGFDFLASVAASLLNGPVTVVGIGARPVADRLRFFDAVASLLPYGFRADLDVDVWVEWTAAHGSRLCFAANADDRAVRVDLTADAPPAVASDTVGHAYLQALREARRDSGEAAVVKSLWRHREAFSFDRAREAVEAVRNLRGGDELVARWVRERVTADDVLDVYDEVLAGRVRHFGRDKRDRLVAECVEILVTADPDRSERAARRLSADWRGAERPATARLAEDGALAPAWLLATTLTAEGDADADRLWATIMAKAARDRIEETVTTCARWVVNRRRSRPDRRYPQLRDEVAKRPRLLLYLMDRYAVPDGDDLERIVDWFWSDPGGQIPASLRPLRALTSTKPASALAPGDLGDKTWSNPKVLENFVEAVVYRDRLGVVVPALGPQLVRVEREHERGFAASLLKKTVPARSAAAQGEADVLRAEVGADLWIFGQPYAVFDPDAPAAGYDAYFAALAAAAATVGSRRPLAEALIGELFGGTFDDHQVRLRLRRFVAADPPLLDDVCTVLERLRRERPAQDRWIVEQIAALGREPAPARPPIPSVAPGTPVLTGPTPAETTGSDPGLESVAALPTVAARAGVPPGQSGDPGEARSGRVALVPLLIAILIVAAVVAVAIVVVVRSGSTGSSADPGLAVETPTGGPTTNPADPTNPAGPTNAVAPTSAAPSAAAGGSTEVQDPKARSFPIPSSTTTKTLAYAPDGIELATGGDGKVSLWRTSKSPPTPQGHFSAPGVRAVAFSPDGKTLVAAGDGVTAWDVSGPEAKATHLDVSDAESLAFSADGKLLAIGGQGKVIQLWDVSRPDHPQKLSAVKVLSGGVRALAFGPDGNSLAASDGKVADLWSIKNRGRPIPFTAPVTGHGKAVTSLAFMPGGSRLATGGSDGLMMSDLGGGAGAFVTNDPANHLAVLPDGRLVIAGGDLVRLVEVEHESILIVVKLKDVNAVALPPAGSHLAAGSEDGTVLINY